MDVFVIKILKGSIQENCKFLGFSIFSYMYVFIYHLCAQQYMKIIKKYIIIKCKDLLYIITMYSYLYILFIAFTTQLYNNRKHK